MQASAALTPSITKRKSRIVIGVLTALFVVLQLIMLVPTSQAATPQNQDYGYLLLYSGQGKYKKAVVSKILHGSSYGEDKCGQKKFSKSNGQITLSLSTRKKDGKLLATKLKCSIGDYRVSFLKKGEKFVNDASLTKVYAAVGLSKGYCSFVHVYGVTRNEAIQAGDKCTGDDDPSEDKVEKVTPVMSINYNPYPITQGKKVTFVVELKHPAGTPLSPEECAGSYARAGTWAFSENKKNEYPLRYNSKMKTCQYRANVGSGTTKKASPGNYSGTLTFIGNKFLNAMSIPYAYDVVAGSKTKAPDAKPSKTKLTSVKLAKDKNAKFNLTTTITVKDAPSCDTGALGVKISAFRYDSGSTKPEAISGEKTPSVASGPIAAAKGKNCIITIVHTYPAQAKGMNVKHEGTVTFEGKTVSKKSGKVKVGQ